MIDSGSQAAKVASYGWNLLDVSYKEAADQLPAGTKALVWLGNYGKSTCTWEVPDSALTTKVRSMAADPKVAGYFISDEPDPYRCPSAPEQHAARTALIHSLSPGKPVIMLMDSNSGKQSLDQIPLWRHAADYVALDPYPCYQGKPCDFSWVDTVIKAADRAGLHYWGVAQAFDDANWRWPTPTELRHILSQWSASKQAGYMTFAWSWRGQTLASRPELLKVFRDFNRTAAKPRSKPKPKTKPKPKPRTDHRESSAPSGYRGHGDRAALHVRGADLGDLQLGRVGERAPVRAHETLRDDGPGRASEGHPVLVEWAVSSTHNHRAETGEDVPLLRRERGVDLFDATRGTIPVRLRGRRGRLQ